MPVHYASHADSLDNLADFAKIHHLRVVEDAAHAFGTEQNGEFIGCQGDVICFSFDGIKNITCGEGGAVVTDDPVLLERLRDARLLGVEKDYLKRKEGKRSWDFDVQHQGYRYHMSDIMAAIGRTQLRKIQKFKEKRKASVQYYIENLSDLSGLKLLKLDYANIMPHIFVVRVLNSRRDGLKDYLQQHQVETGIHYKPNHLLARYKTSYPLKNAEKIYQEILTLPLHVELEQHEQAHIVSVIKEYLSHG
jgi:dTDP-4-amino-4,6-dideoxygalactose transaminase